MPQETPVQFVPARWRPHVIDREGQIDRHYFELCVLWETERAQYAYFGWPDRSSATYQIFDLNRYVEEPLLPTRVAELRAEGAEVLLDRDGVVVLKRR